MSEYFVRVIESTDTKSHAVLPWFKGSITVELAVFTLAFSGQSFYMVYMNFPASLVFGIIVTYALARFLGAFSPGQLIQSYTLRIGLWSHSNSFLGKVCRQKDLDSAKRYRTLPSPTGIYRQFEK